MKAHEIYQALDAEIITRMLDWFRDNDRNVYKSAIASLAQTRKLRPVFVQKKSLPEQYAWAVKTLRLRSSDAIGEHLVQAWLMSGEQEMLGKFCDAMGIEHDGKGSVTGELPEAMEPAKLDAAVDALLESHDPRVVTLYLQVFNLQRTGGWDALAEKLASDERLKLS